MAGLQPHERIIRKIQKIKAALAADKKRWGGFYRDGGGLRYAPPELFIQMGDFSGGLRYLNWFAKNFPDDSGYPDFLFEWTFILFKTGLLKAAEKKAFETFTRNTYLFDRFFDRPIVQIDKWERSNLEIAAFATDHFHYNSGQENMSDFSGWLDQLLRSERFSALTNRYITLSQQLKVEKEREVRRKLIDQMYQLLDEV
ncbi:hypothetical protein [Rurimicrobium arvi]|uniref:AbiV family abortive infection protein n=1 Tax=Rurimicrobium arvi TaxID=2049916 RepID=A0ABP8MU60_9BACT